MKLKTLMVFAAVLALTACEVKVCYDDFCIVVIHQAQETIEEDIADGTATSANFTLEVSGDNVQVSNDYADVEIRALDGGQIVSTTTASVDFNGNIGHVMNTASMDNWVAGLSRPSQYTFEVEVPELDVEAVNRSQPIGQATFQVMYYSEALTNPVNIN